MVNKSSAHARETVLCEGSNEVGMAKVLRVYERSDLLIETIGLCLGQQELECESRKVVNYLCKNKADVGAAAMDDMGAVHFAAQKGHLEGMTALHYAAQGSNLELVKYLLKKGANLSVKNKAAKTPIDLASNDDIRSFLHECETTSIQEALGGGEKSDEAKSNPSSVENAEGSEVKADEEGDGEAEDAKDESVKRKADSEENQAEDAKDESVKRKADGEENEENSKETKKAKVALNHLLASDDVQEEEEEENL
nr:ankyrin repeat domain-containing protein, chloroplastic [Ipomoea batatas]